MVNMKTKALWALVNGHTYCLAVSNSTYRLIRYAKTLRNTRVHWIEANRPLNRYLISL